MGKRDSGTCYIKVNGDQLVVEGGVEVPLSVTGKEAVFGNGRVVGYKETGRKPYVKATMRKLSPKQFQALTQADDLTITAELAGGGVYTLSDAWVEGEPSYNADEGTADVEFVGLRGEWA